jgi:rRNA-processing protein FCF1
MITSRTELAVLLNALYDEGVDRISVDHPCDEIGTLLNIELGDAEESTVRIRTGRQSYAAQRDDVGLHYDESAYEDLPNAHAYCQALTAGGLIDVANQTEIEEFLERYGYPDLEAGHPPVFAGIDANIFPWRLPEALGFDPERSEYDDCRPPVNGYALSSGVKEELDWHYKQQYTRQVTEAFGDEFNRLGEQPAGGRRAGFLGLYEFRRLRANRRSDIVETGRGDEEIVDGYQSYADESRKEVLLFSNDHGFVEYAKDSGVPAIHVEYPVGTPRKVTATWDDIRDTLYVLSIIFGVLKLPKVTLYGVWDGKSGRHWKDEQIDIDARSPSVKNRLQREQALLDAYDLD